MIKEATRPRRTARKRLTARQQRLVEENLGLAYLMARRYAKGTISTDDLIGAASEALCLASISWNRERGPFARYAASACANAARTEARLLAELIRVPVHMTRQVRLCSTRYVPGMIPSRGELITILEQKRPYGDQQYQHFRNAWFLLHGQRSSVEVPPCFSD